MRLTNFGRKCEVKIRTWVKHGEGQPNTSKDSLEQGTFHMWGSNVERKKNSPVVAQTIGIVELENGKIVRLLPEFVEFKEPIREVEMHSDVRS